MKKLFGVLAAVAFVGIVAATGWTLYQKSRTPVVVYATATPGRADIVRKTVATGSVVPRKEVQVKPLISGIVEDLYVEEGQTVRQGELVARVRVIPRMVELSSGETRVNQAEIALADAEREYRRQQRLSEEGIVATAALQAAEVGWQKASEELQAAEDALDIVRRGTSERLRSATTTLVPATISGMVLEIPVEVGNSVIESNNFNEGTTIATVADMGDMIFEGRVDESEVGKIRPGMELLLTIGALPERTIGATLEHIAPKGVEEEGAIQFEIRAAVEAQKDMLIRANYSASADIVLDRRDDVLAIDEGLLQFDGEQAYVEVETAPQRFERRDLEIGLSDGIQIEVVSGLSESDRIKNPNPEAVAGGAPGGPTG